MTDPRADLLIPVSRAIYEAQWEEGFDDLNTAGIEYAMALQLGRAAIEAMAGVLLTDGRSIGHAETVQPLPHEPKPNISHPPAQKLREDGDG